MEINKDGSFIPTPMPQLFWDHDQETLTQSLGITKKRKRELERKLEDMLDDENEPKKKYKRFSALLEAVLNLAENEQERILLAVDMGRKNGGGGGAARMVLGSGGDLGAQLDEMIKEMIKKFRRDSED